MYHVGIDMKKRGKQEFSSEPCHGRRVITTPHAPTLRAESYLKRFEAWVSGDKAVN
jgi:hypothetical protein